MIEQLESRTHFSAGVLGVFRNGTWIIDANDSRGYDGGDIVFTFGTAGDTPVSGDFNGDGTPEIGVFRGGWWILDTNHSMAYDGGDLVLGYGSPGDKAVWGDFNADGRTDPGVFRNGRFIIDTNGNGRYNGTDAVFNYGVSTDTPFAADYNGDGRAEVGVARISKGLITYIMDSNYSRAYDASDTVVMLRGANERFATPLVGRWRNSGIEDRLGHYNHGGFFIDANKDGVLSGALGPGQQDFDEVNLKFGVASDVAILVRPWW